MQGLTIALLMREQLSGARADSLASRSERAKLERRRIEKGVHPRAPRQAPRTSEATSDPGLGWLPRIISSPLNR